MNTVRLIIGILGTLFFGYATIRFWGEMGGTALFMIAVDIFFIIYTIFHLKNRTN